MASRTFRPRVASSWEISAASCPAAMKMKKAMSSSIGWKVPVISIHRATHRAMPWPIEAAQRVARP